MRAQNRPFRLTASAAIAALVLAQTLPQLALAQGAPPSPPQAGVPDQQQSGDPPASVGRLALLSGTVSFHPPEDQQWSAATLNYPVMQGDAFWTEPNARAVIEIAASRVAMAPATELDIGSLGNSAFQATALQGELYLNVQTATPDESYAVQTPRGLINFTAPGRYGVVAGDTQNPTTVTVVEGSARIEGPGVSLDVGPNQTASITGTDAFQGDVGPAQRDAFLTAMLDSERPPQLQAGAPPAAVAAMPGGDDLTQYGSWSDSTEYGQVWYPQVAPDWVPYREGSWDYVAPWGWTWVDSEPWGFAPFHYGRWADIGGRWAWVPGGAAAPIYAPALVTFLGVGAVVGVAIGAALAAGRIGWCPLGPHEAYHPWYRASDRYFRQVNISHVTNFNTINRNVSFNNFVNRRATTVVPTSTMTASRPVGSSFQHLDPAQLSQVRPFIGAQPLRPTSTTVGVTPAVARQLNMPPPTAGLRQISPGPVFRGTPAVATGFATGAVTGRPGLPTLHNPALPGAVPAAVGVHPFIATPGLRAPPAPGQVGPPTINHGPVAASPGAVVHEPPLVNRGGGIPPGTITHVPPVTTVQQGAPPGDVHVPLRHTVSPPPPVGQAAPPVVVHAPPSPPVVVHAPAPPPVVHTPPPPVVVHAAPPPPVVRVAPNPTPQFRAPPPVVHNPPPPPPQNTQHKRPGEP